MISITANLQVQNEPSHVLLQNEVDLLIQTESVVQVTRGGQNLTLK